LAVQQQAATGQGQQAVKENMPKKRNIDQTRDYKKKLPLPAKKKTRKQFPHLSCRQIANLTVESDSDFE